MKPEARYEWLENHIRNNMTYRRAGVDILDSDFVDEYIEATNARHRTPMWGACKCPQLGRDLKAMYDRGVFKRIRVGLTDGSWQPGFPKWVWCYRLTVGADH